MNPATVAALGSAPYKLGLRVLKKPRKVEADIVGLSVEYDKGGRLVCWQIAGPEFVRVFRPPFTLERLEAECMRAGASRWQILLPAFYSIAQLSFLPVLERATGLRTFGTSLDVDFKLPSGRTLTILDLSRFFPGETLEEIARSMGRKKTAAPLPLDQVDAECASMPAFLTYAAEDARLARDIALELQTAYSLDLAAYSTPAGAAGAEFRHQWLDGDMDPPAPSVRRLALLSLHGGRVEAFFRGAVPVAQEYDFASAYPSAALEFGALPLSDQWAEVRTIPRDAPGLAEVYFHFPADCWAPCLPQETDGALLFPLEGHSFATFDEIRLAQELGARIEVVRAAAVDGLSSESPASFFKDKLRARAVKWGSAERVTAKLSANSLIGKFGQRVRVTDWRAFLIWAREDGRSMREIARTRPEMIRALGFDAGFCLGSCYAPEWSALILGRVRAKLGRLIAAHGAIYAHTDSLWTCATIKDPPAGLELRARGRAIVARSMLGMIGAHVAHQGIGDHGAAVVLLENIARGSAEGVTWKTRKPTRLAESFGGPKFGSWQEEKATSSGAWDGKRELLADGSTRPWRRALEFLEWRRQNSGHGKNNSAGPQGPPPF